MVGFPMLAGFISKLLFATSALQSPNKMIITLIGLAVSTTLNAIYFLRLVITLYSREGDRDARGAAERSAVRKSSWKLRLAVLCFIFLNLILGLKSQPIVQAIAAGLSTLE